MRICVIIAEYNPFHMGHKEQIEYIKSNYPDTAVFAVMSGNIVQRGELAVLDKYKRAEAAVRCGADAVLELPYPYCCSSAGYFAKAGVSIAHNIGADMLCFGSENGDIEYLKTVAKNTLSKEYNELLERLTKESKNSAESYISLYRKAYEELYGEKIPEGANNTLAIEYLRAIFSLDYSIEPITNKRTSPYSATASRAYYKNNDAHLCDAVPKEAYVLYKENSACRTEAAGNVILWHFRNAKAGELCSFADVDEGLASRLISCAHESITLNEFYSKAATKKYTDSRIRRAVFNCFFGVTKERLEKEAAFTTLLAANETGCKALRQIKKRQAAAPDSAPNYNLNRIFIAQGEENPYILNKQSSFPVITKPANYTDFSNEVSEAFAFSKKADMLFASAVKERSADCLRKKPIILL